MYKFEINLLNDQNTLKFLIGNNVEIKNLQSNQYHGYDYTRDDFMNKIGKIINTFGLNVEIELFNSQDITRSILVNFSNIKILKI